MHFPSRHVSQHRRASFRARLSGSRYGQATSVEDPFGYLGELRWIGWDLVILRPLKLLSDFRKHKPHPSWYSLEPVASLGWPTVHWRRSLRKTVIPKLSSKSSHINPYQCPTVKMDGLSMFIQVEKDQMVQWSPKSYSQVPSQSDPWFHPGLGYRPVAGTATSSCLCALLDLLMSWRPIIQFHQFWVFNMWKELRLRNCMMPPLSNCVRMIHRSKRCLKMFEGFRVAFSGVDFTLISKDVWRIG